MSSVLQTLWYEPHASKKNVAHNLLLVVLLFFSFFYKAVIVLREKAYKKGLIKSYASKLPLIVVGNLTVGGTGKTPLIITLVEFLKKEGYRPGIVSRGYGGKTASYPLLVTDKILPKEAGDEPVLLAFRTQCPVVVSPRRIDAVHFLEKNMDCNVILSDDGLQHFAMQRDMEIIVIDGERRFGNGFCLPAGPLREPVKCSKTADFLVNNMSTNTVLQEKEYGMRVFAENFTHVYSKEAVPVDFFKQKSTHVVTGIGNPNRFLSTLDTLNIVYDARVFNDHHVFVQQDLMFDKKEPIIMTEKDAVKCQYLTAENDMYYLKVKAVMNDDAFEAAFLKKVESIIKTKENKQ